jgi:uncharacterized protein (TIGR01244 family)
MKSRIVAAVATAILLAGGPVAAQVTHADVPGIRNYSYTDPGDGIAGTRVGFGGATDLAAMPWLAEQGYAAVINVRLASEEGANVEASRAAAEAAGLVYIHLPFNSRDPDPQLFDKFTAAVGDAGNRPVYVHCGSATRVAALWMIWRVTEDGWDIDAARAEAQSIALKPEQAVAFAEQYLSNLEE